MLEFTNIQLSDWDLYTCQGELGDQFEVLGTLVIVERKNLCVYMYVHVYLIYNFFS